MADLFSNEDTRSLLRDKYVFMLGDSSKFHKYIIFAHSSKQTEYFSPFFFFCFRFSHSRPEKIRLNRPYTYFTSL